MLSRLESDRNLIQKPDFQPGSITCLTFRLIFYLFCSGTSFPGPRGRFRARAESVCAALWAFARAFWAWRCPIGGGDSIPKSAIFGRILTSFPGPFSSAEGVGPPNLPHISSGPGRSFETRPDGEPSIGALLAVQGPCALLAGAKTPTITNPPPRAAAPQPGLG